MSAAPCSRPMRSARCARICSSCSSRGNGRSSPPSYAISPIASSRGSSTRCRAFKPSQTQGISTMPNERFEEFADRFMKSIGEPGCDLQALVDELIELHAVERDEFNRVRLISMHIALTNIAAEGLSKAQAPGSQIIGFLADNRSEEHTSEIQSLMRISYAVFCLIQK